MADNVLEADYVVVGSGAGGAPLAARLALAGHEVLVLEAGEDAAAGNLNYEVPALHGQATQDPRLQWSFFVQHYADAGRQSHKYDSKYDMAKGGILYPRAGTFGGCTAHHAMITIYPHNSDWQRLADLTADTSWGPEAMRAQFERLEQCGYVPRPLLPGLNRGRHGFNGWLSTELADPKLAVTDEQLLTVIVGAAVGALTELLTAKRSPLDLLHDLLRQDPLELAALLAQYPGDPKATLRAALARHLDPNDWRVAEGRREGVFMVPLATDNGQRNGPREFLREAGRRSGGKLRIEPNALARKVLFDSDPQGTAATGVEYLKGPHLYQADPAYDAAAEGEPWIARARREVILAGGQLNTPQLLMLSGIGPPEELVRAGLACRVSLPGVGQNLQDRYEVGVAWEMTEDFTVLAPGVNFRVPEEGSPADPALETWKQSRSGLYTSNGAVLGIVRRSNPDLPDPDLFIFGLPGYFKGYFVHYADIFAAQRNLFTWAILKGHTKDRAGYVKLNATNPQDPRAVPAINFKYFDEGTDGGADDLKAVVEGVKFVRRMMGHPTIAARVKGQYWPKTAAGGQAESDADIEESVRREAWGHHACGTCKIGPRGDPGAVVDGDFRVHGTRNLRVVDASVFPDIPGFFIVTPIYMISEKASQVILGAAQPVPSP